MLCYLHKTPKDLERYKEEEQLYVHPFMCKIGVKFHSNLWGYC